MQNHVTDTTRSAYAYPLLIKHLLHTPLAHAPDQEIVYRGRQRLTYSMLRERIAQLANGLSALGVKHGSTVAMMDWDSHRYLECYFAVPMMGAVLQTVNVRLSQAEILYTINHAGAQVLLVHTDFLPVIDAIKDQFETVHTFIWINDDGRAMRAHDSDLG
ncbi:acyl-CoA synthetase (AMP-forming)/AMP-acid ligase II [Paraburkholderia sp. MM5477-R1]